MTQDEAREEIISGIDYDAYHEADFSLHDSDRNRLLRQSTPVQVPDCCENSPDRRPLGACWLKRAALLLFALGCLFQPIARAQVKEVRRVLIFYEYGLSSPGMVLLDQGIRDALPSSPYQVEVYREYLETTLFPVPATQQEFRRWYLHKYQDRKPDLIIAVGPSPLRFLLDTHEEYFTGTPVVFCGTTEDLADHPQLDSHFTGVWEKAEAAKTLEAALLLQPGTKHVVVVGGTTSYDRHLEASVKKDLGSYASRLDITYLTDLTMPELLKRLKHLPEHSVVLLTDVAADAAGTTFVGSAQATPMVTSAANVPVFTLADVDLGHGEVGGDVSSFAREGEIVGNIVQRILKGERPGGIPIVAGANVYMFDWRALRRWGSKESNLPPGSIVLNRPQSFWQLHKRYVLAGIFVLLVQMVVIVGLLWQRARKRRAEAELSKSEERFSKTFRQSPLVVTISRTSDSRFIDVNESFEEQLGWTRDEVIGRTPEDFDFWVDADQRAEFLKRLRTNGSVRNLEVRLRKKDGETRAALVSAELIEVGSEPCTVSVAADITERKRAEDVISSVSRRLIEAHEEERTRIARELHDDINQRLALLAVKLSSLKKEVPALDALTRQYVDEVGQEVRDLGKDVQALSHRLHSSKLEYLGLAVAAGGFCREFSQRQNVAIEYRHDNIPRNLSPEISLCLFRVLQEALQNALKYSGVRRFEASLESASNEIHLIVRDSGVGFDPESAKNHHGLGLISMRERLKLVDGQLSIDSKPQCGTTIHASVPLKSNARSGVQVRIATA